VRTSSPRVFVLTIGIVVVGCSGSDVSTPPGGDGGASNSLGGTTSEVGGSVATGGGISNGTGGSNSPTGGALGTGGTVEATGGRATGGALATGGSKAATGGSPPTATGGMMPATGGAPPTGTGGIPATGGSKAGTGGSPPTGTGGMPATGGSKAGTGGSPTTATGGMPATGGSKAGTGGSKATGGMPATGGASAVAGGSAVNCSATMPTGGTAHCGSNTQGTAGGLTWSLWCNSLSSSACITTYNTSAFSASWANNSDFLARIGLEWGSSGKSYTAYAAITAQYAYTKTGTAGGYSYIGIYGWSNNPCVEYYIIDDSYGTMPFTPYQSTSRGSATLIDGANYKFYSNTTNGTGGSRCPSGTTSWTQFWSVRQTARQCGTISISQHFSAWAAAGMTLGTNLLEAKILVETGGGTGSLNFPVASVTAQ